MRRRSLPLRAFKIPSALQLLVLLFLLAGSNVSLAGISRGHVAGALDKIKDAGGIIGTITGC